jgi:hypothetical protein
MRAIIRFFKSPMGKFLLVAVALIVVAIIVMKEMEKKVYGGLTKSKYIDSIAQMLFDSKLNAIKTEAGYSEANLPQMLGGYYAGYTSGSIDNATSIARVSQAVDDSNIDFSKVKDLAALKEEVLQAYFNKFKQ